MTYKTDLQNNLLISMPQMKDSIFEHSVIYICHHDSDGAMGLILNKPISNIDFEQLAHSVMEENLEVISEHLKNQIFAGGPVDTSQGFILHSSDYLSIEDSNKVSDDIYLNASVDLVVDIAIGQGPSKFISFLGYSGWGAGQLEQEILDNKWLNHEASAEFIWNTPPEKLWEHSLKALGLSESFLSVQAGHS